MPDCQPCTLQTQTLLVQTGAAVRLKVKRRLSQLFMLAVLGQWAFYGIFRCPFLVPYVSCQNCPVITCHGRIVSMFWGFWLLIPLSVVFFGRAFCGWACPGGLINQMLGMIAPCKLRVRNFFTRLAPSGKYLGLALAFAAYYLLGQPRADVPIRIGEFFQSVLLTFEHASMNWLIRTFLVIALVVLGLLAANFWCRFACPTGGLLELVKRITLFKFYKTSACNDCNQCLAVCEMGTRPDEKNCTNCGDCQGICPSNAIIFGHKK
ncbi:MAG: 4Fe-4S binding protein [Desulforhopalus sp.]|nr:4Fe-4S binding protein [Desulforhopalus sp.]